MCGNLKFIAHQLPFLHHHILMKDLLNYMMMCFSLTFCIVSDFCLCCLLSRFGKKKEEKKEAKAALQRQKSEILSDHELERMKDERER